MNTHGPTQTRKRRGGQAMIEFVIALVAILAVCAGLLQVASLTKAQTDAMFEARRAAARNMFAMGIPAGDADYIRHWQEGPDRKRMTADDTTTPADGSQFAATIVGKTVADATDWPVIAEAPDPAFLALQGNGAPVREFGLIGGEERRSVELLPAVQHLLYNADSIDVDAKVWMTWTRGIY